ncbi:MAG: hypothetical protein HIU84_12145 [Acidobacteria bacterium]|nr:hypothetical protein [Acidobacteriota bacterium]
MIREDSLPRVRELASGVDALYLSGRAVISADLEFALNEARARAEEIDDSVPFDLGGVEMQLQARAFGKYRFSLDHLYGRVGITASKSLPAIRVQPRAEFLHGIGPRAAVEWFAQHLENACGPVLLTVSRLDLFADFQGWSLNGDDRREFLCRATDLGLREASDEFNGLQFGKRTSGTISARLYDKTIESAKTGSLYWKDIWGENFDPDQQVLRVEFELARDALRQFGVNRPDEVLDATGSLWAYLTTQWLTHRAITDDQNKSRRPVSSDWRCVQRARIAENDYGISRTYGGKTLGQIWNILPALTGYLANFGALTHSESFADLVPHLSNFLAQYAERTDTTMRERIADKRRKNGLP